MTIDPNELLRELTGNEPCPLCSTKNWNVYHTPENPCPKAHSSTGNTRSQTNE